MEMINTNKKEMANTIQVQKEMMNTIIMLVKGKPIIER